MVTLAQIEPRTPISSVPFFVSIPGSYYLTTNLIGASGIYINSGNVVLDLNGFTLQGLAGSASGIRVNGPYTNIVVRHGFICGWGLYGLDAFTSGTARNMLFEDLVVAGNSGRGIMTQAGSVVRHCLCYTNGSDGIYTAGGEVVDCLARGNQNGFYLSQATARRCRAEYNATGGITLDSSRALDCEIENNGGAGLTLSGSDCEVRGCHVTGNTSLSGVFSSGGAGHRIADCDISHNAGSGIRLNGTGGCLLGGNHLVFNSGAAVLISENNDILKNNTIITSNGTPGIEVTSTGYTNNVMVNNIVSGAGSATLNYNNVSSSDVGPIGSAATLTSPMGNISH